MKMLISRRSRFVQFCLLSFVLTFVYLLFSHRHDFDLYKRTELEFVSVQCIDDGKLSKSIDNGKNPVHSTSDSEKKEQEGCVVDFYQLFSFPNCTSKLAWLKNNWARHNCFQQMGVNDSECTMIQYLNQIEDYCPPIMNRNLELNAPLTKHNTNLRQLINIIRSGCQSAVDLKEFRFLVDRIESLWSSWISGLELYRKWINDASFGFDRTIAYSGPLLDGSRRLRIHVHAASRKPNDAAPSSGQMISTDRRLELIQWADLLACLHLLGHNLSFSLQPSQLKQRLRGDLLPSDPCQVERTAVDMLYTSLTGYHYLTNENIMLPACKYRLLEPLGIGVDANQAKLHLKQYNTIFPNKADNTFLGFVLPDREPESSGDTSISTAKPIAWLVDPNSLEKLSPHMPSLREAFRLEVRKNLFPGDFNVTRSDNRFTNSSKKILLVTGHQLIDELVVFDAILHGFTVIEFHQPESNSTNNQHSLTNNQYSYAGQHFGDPNLFRVELGNTSQLDAVIERIARSETQPPPDLPFELTPVGYIERLNAYLHHVNFCSDSYKLHLLQTPLPLPTGEGRRRRLPLLDMVSSMVAWPPPLTSLRLILAPPGLSCTQACHQLTPSQPSPLFSSQDQLDRYPSHRLADQPHFKADRLSCDSHHFTSANNRRAIEAYLKEANCAGYAVQPLLVAPLVNGSSQTCILQADLTKFTCDAIATGNQRRICPCRDSARGQEALCSTCF